jgi:phosphoglycerate dehydrogenase-like enzyme
MKIAMLSTPGEYADQLLAALRTGTPYGYTAWAQGSPAPSNDFEVLIVMGPADRARMQAQPKLGLVQAASAGYEGIDADAATELGIWVAHAPSDETGNATSVAEHTILLLLATSRHLGQELALTHGRADASTPKPPYGVALAGRTVCVVGLGGIGHKVVERLRPFGVHLTIVDPHPEHAPADATVFRPDRLLEAIAVADYVVLALPADKANENLFHAETFAAMKQGAILINIARGSLVDEQALLASIRAGHLGGAGLDVVRDEPIAHGNPLLTEPRILVTPHLAGFTTLTFEGTVAYLTKALAEYERGVRSSGIVNEPVNPRHALRS